MPELTTPSLNFAPVALLRVTPGISAKGDRLARARLSNTSVEQIRPGHVVIKVGNSKGVRRTADGFTFSTEGRRMTPTYTSSVARFLFKAALEFTYLDLGFETAMHPRLDEVRSIVRGASFNGYLLMSKQGSPGTHNQVSFTTCQTQGPRPTSKLRRMCLMCISRPISWSAILVSSTRACVSTTTSSSSEPRRFTTKKSGCDPRGRIPWRSVGTEGVRRPVDR